MTLESAPVLPATPVAERRPLTRIHHGDEVAIGPLIYRLEDPPTPPPPPPAPAAAKPAARKDDPDEDLVPLSGQFPDF